MASVVRHKRDDEDRSSDYDKLMTAEQVLVFISFFLLITIEIIWSIRAVADTRGIHSGKEIPPSKQPLNISEVSASLHQVEYIINMSDRQVHVPFNF